MKIKHTYKKRFIINYVIYIHIQAKAGAKGECIADEQTDVFTLDTPYLFDKQCGKIDGWQERWVVLLLCIQCLAECLTSLVFFTFIKCYGVEKSMEIQLRKPNTHFSVLMDAMGCVIFQRMQEYYFQPIK